jgi:uncharacterized membrane protein HdeD (DUF308 family)
MALSKIQRRFVWRHCVHPLLTRWSVMITKTVLLLLFIIAAYWLGAFGSLALSIAMTIAIVFLIPELLDLWLVTRHRQDIEAYIQSHGSEIQSVVS